MSSNQHAQRWLDSAWKSYQNGQLSTALEHCRKAVKENATLAPAWHLLGAIQAASGEHGPAVASYKTALRCGGHKNPDLLVCLAASSLDLDQLPEADDYVQRALKLQPQHVYALNNLGNLRVRQGRPNEAISAYERTLALAPQHGNALKALTRLLVQAERMAQAQALAERALALFPDELALWQLLALARHGDYRMAGLRDALQRTLAREPDHMEALKLSVLCANQLQRFGEALTFAERLPLEQRLEADVLHAYASALAASGRAEEATALLLQASPNADSDALFYLNYNAGMTAHDIAQAHLDWGQRLAAQHTSVAAPVAHEPERRLRVGLVSGDFRAHAVALFLNPLLTHLDRSAFELIAYQTNLEVDQVTQHLKSLFNDWRDVSALNEGQPQALSALIQSDQIDLLIDLSGHSGGNRLASFALQPAPVQVTYLGYPNTTGLAAMHYRISDARADPPGDPLPSAEQIVRLPDCFHCYQADGTHPLQSRPVGACITFGSFNNFAKVNTPTIAAWAKILLAVPGSRLLLKAQALGDPVLDAALRQRFAAHGVAPERLTLLGRVNSQQGHMALYQQIDIALDTFPYNGTTTTCEALWMGVPVVSFSGDRHAARVGASLLHACGHTELLGRDVNDYIDIAVRLANDDTRLRDYHHNLRSDLQTSPLMDGPRFASHFGAALRDMWRRSCQANGVNL